MKLPKPKVLALLIVIHLLFVGVPQAQNTAQSFDALRIELGKKVNGLRQSQGLQPLQPNDVLQTAARNHSNYMAKTNVLTHTQESVLSSTPKKRVETSGGVDFEVVSENVLYTGLRNFPLSTIEVGELAQEMFLSWKNSPGHYANMVSQEYELGDFGFAVSPSSKNIYATQVFGKKGIIVGHQLSNDAFGLKEAEGACDEQFHYFSNVVANMGNGFRIENGTIMFYYHNMSFFQEVFKRPNDGLSVDLVFRKQFPCDGSNQLDLSSIHDGILLKPVYRDQLMAGNQAQSSYRVIVPVGKVPDRFIGEEMSPSFVLIQNGKKCRYFFPGKVPSEGYKLREIEPVTYEPQKTSMSNSGIVASQEIEFDFKTNSIIPISFPKILKYDAKVHSIEIKSYSSVEGDSSKNAALHDGRAKAIQDYIQKNIMVADSVVHIEAKENWSQMNFQLHYFFREDLAALPHDTLKKILAVKGERLPWDSLLFTQRKSTAVINYWSDLPDSGIKVPGFPLMNLRTAIDAENLELANRALYELYRQNDAFNDILFESTVFNACKKYPELVVNYSAILSQIYWLNTQKTADFIFNWIYRENELSQEAKFNLLHLYTLLGSSLLQDWDLEAARLSNVVHPLKMGHIEKEISLKELILNLQLTYIQYFGQINDGENINKSFTFITDYFKEVSLSQEDDVKLMLFFNNWSMYSLTIEHLTAKYEKDDINEEGVFILAQTMSFYSEDRNAFMYESIHKKALALNAKRWCEWISKDYQLLRHGVLKAMYCESCSK
jgi:uncharacterized protein YkwD